MSPDLHRAEVAAFLARVKNGEFDDVYPGGSAMAGHHQQNGVTAVRRPSMTPVRGQAGAGRVCGRCAGGCELIRVITIRAHQPLAGLRPSAVMP
jgi:hypothetical protein